MSLNGTCRQMADVAVIDFSGRITLGEGSSALRRMVQDLIQNGQQRILLNLADVDYIDSSGIGELVNAFSKVRDSGGELKLMNLTKRVHDILQIARLYTVFDVQTDESIALQSFRKSA